MTLNDFTSFDKMITPVIIKIFFWLGVALSIISGIIMLFGGGVETVIGILTIIFGPLFIRVYCELLIILFKIHENLNAIRHQKES